jgi:phospholipid/cholesterol/gamma-HCH transport system permease protein
MLKKESAFFSGIWDFLLFLGGFANLASKTFYWIFVPPMKKERVFEQAKKAGVDSFMIVSLISFFLGMIMAFQISYLMRRLGAEMYIASVVSLSIVMELGPVITALIIAGRVGAAITAEIGSMTVTEQVDALETLATDPVKYLVVPRFLALTVMLPLLTIYADLIGIPSRVVVGKKLVNGMVELVDRKTRQTVEIPVAEAARAVQAKLGLDGK